MKNENITAALEGVILVCENEVPKYMVRRNGTIVYFKLEEMNFGDHSEMWGAKQFQETISKNGARTSTVGNITIMEADRPE